MSDKSKEKYINNLIIAMKIKGYELFSSSAELHIKHQVKESQENQEGSAMPGKDTNMIAVIGDRFMNGGFLPKEVLQKSYKQWNGTLHDINHMGTSTGFFLMQTDITYFIGYHKNVKYDEASKAVSMELVIHNRTKFAEAWQAYIELCSMAGQIPNVSVTYFAQRKFVPTSELPKEADWKKEGYGKDDLVPVLTNIIPFCVSTVLQGRCGDKDGCGIRSGNACECDLSKIDQNLLEQLKDDNHESEEDSIIKQKREEQIKRIKKLKETLLED
jgi:hypothetical protein